MENTRPHYPVPEVPEGKIIFHDDVLHWLVKHVGNHIKDLTPDVGSEELCAATGHANVVVCASTKGKEDKNVENVENSLWKNLVDFNALFKKKKSPSTESPSRRYIIISRSLLLCSFLIILWNPVSQKLIRCIEVQQEGYIPASHMQKPGTLKETHYQGLLQIH